MVLKRLLRVYKHISSRLAVSSITAFALLLTATLTFQIIQQGIREVTAVPGNIQFGTTTANPTPAFTRSGNTTTFYDTTYYSAPIIAGGGSNSNWAAINAPTLQTGSYLYSYGPICTGNVTPPCSSTGGVAMYPGATSGSPAVALAGSGNSWFNAGNLGVGVTNPSQKVSIGGNLGFPTNVASTNPGYPVLQNVAGFGLQISTLKFGVNVGSNTNPSVVINENGNVGIATTNPTQSLTVNGYSLSTRYYTTATSNAYIAGDGSGIMVGGGYLYATNAGTSFYSQNQAVFRGGIINDSGALSINNGGHTYFNGTVGVGYASSSGQGLLTVNGTVFANGNLSLQGDSNKVINMTAQGPGNGGSLFIQAAGSDVNGGSIYMDGSNAGVPGQVFLNTLYGGSTTIGHTSVGTTTINSPNYNIGFSPTASTGVYSGTTGQSFINYVFNGGLEKWTAGSNPDGWGPCCGTPTQTFTKVAGRTGNSALRITQNQAVDGRLAIIPQGIPIQAGKQVFVSAYIRKVSGTGDIYIALDPRDIGGGNSGTACTTNSVTSASWVRTVAQCTLPATVGGSQQLGSIMLWVTSSQAYSGTIYEIDDVTVSFGGTLLADPSSSPVTVHATSLNSNAYIRGKLGSNVDSTSQPTGPWQTILYNAVNAANYNGLLVKNNWNASGSTVFEAGTDLVGGAYVRKFRVKGDGNADLAGCMTYNGGTLGTCLSDANLKQNIQPMIFKHALQKLNLLRVKTFEYKTDPGKRYPGLIAQEVQKVAPELVEVDKENHLNLRYGDIQWLTIQAIQEQDVSINELKDDSKQQDEKIEALQEEVDTLKKAVQKLREEVER